MHRSEMEEVEKSNSSDLRIVTIFRSMIDRFYEFLERPYGYWVAYACIFAISALIAFSPLVIYDRSFIWTGDGLDQTYVWFVYTGEWYRSIIKALFSGQGLVVPLYTFNLGYGSDILVSLASSLFDPFSMVSTFVHEDFSQKLYDAMVIVRLFCAGIAFSLFGKYWGFGKGRNLLGAFAYVFSGYCIICYSQPFFLNPLIYFPLILLGVEKILDRRSPLLFIVMLFWAFISQFFFAYVVIVFLIPYCFVRFYQRYGSFKSTGFAKTFFKVFFFCAVAIGLAGVVLVPTLSSMLNMGRLSIAKVLNPLYDYSYYSNLLVGFTSYADMGKDAIFGFTPLAFIASVVICMRRKRHPILFLSFIIMILFILLPICGKALNAFQYPANRWCFVLALFVPFMLVRVFDEIGSLSNRERQVLTISVIAYCLLACILPRSGTAPSFLTVAVSLVTLLLSLFISNWSHGATDRYREFGLFSLVVVFGIFLNVTVLIPEGGNTLSQCVSDDQALSEYQRSLIAPLEGVSDDSGWRCDASVWGSGNVALGYRRNAGLLLGLRTPSFYNSLYNDYVDQWNTEVGLTTTDGMTTSYNTLQSRSGLMALTGVRYFCTPSNTEESEIPFMFREPYGHLVSELSTQSVSVYESTLSLPLAFGYDAKISSSDFQSASMVDKEDLLLKGIVCEDSDCTEISSADEDSVSEPEVSLSVARQNADGTYTNDVGNAISLNGDTITVRNSGTALILTYDGADDSDAYLQFEGYSFKPLTLEDKIGMPLQDAPRGLLVPALWDTLLAGQGWSKITVSSNGNAAGLNTVSPYQDNLSHLYGGKTQYAFNLGSSSSGSNQVIIEFNTPATYTIDKISIALKNMDDFASDVKKLQGNSAQDIHIGTNSVSAQTDYATNKALFFSIPYSSGWKAYVDGVEVPLYHADTAFMALDVDSGKHTIELRYETPYLDEGLLVSTISILVLGLSLAVRLFLRRTRKSA